MASETRAPSRWRGRATAGAKILLGAGLLWLLHSKGLLDPSRVGHAIVRHPGWALCVVLLHAIVFVSIGARWRYVARAGGLGIPAGTAQKLTFVSHFFSTCLPGNGAGDLVKGVILSRTGVPFADVLGTMAVDRVSGMAGLFLAWNGCMGAVAALHPATRPLLLPVLPFTLAVAAGLLASLFATSPLLRAVRRARGRLPATGFIARIADEAVSTIDRMARCTASASTVAVAVAVSACVQCLLFLVALCAARTLSIPLGFVEAGAVLPLASLANSLPISPGGLGVGETAASLAFTRLGLPADSGAELMLVVRLALAILAVVGGLVYAFTTVRTPALEPSPAADSPTKISTSR